MTILIITLLLMTLLISEHSSASSPTPTFQLASFLVTFISKVISE
jgi:hypothetical protein